VELQGFYSEAHNHLALTWQDTSLVQFMLIVLLRDGVSSTSSSPSQSCRMGEVLCSRCWGSLPEQQGHAWPKSATSAWK